MDSSFLALYDSVMSSFDQYLSGGGSWFETTYPDRQNELLAYFSAEFAIHNSLPIYAGGLGVLAGDTCKEASDLGLPLVAVGFIYPQGYFHQQISADGWHEIFSTGQPSSPKHRAPHRNPSGPFYPPQSPATSTALSRQYTRILTLSSAVGLKVEG